MSKVVMIFIALSASAFLIAACNTLIGVQKDLKSVTNEVNKSTKAKHEHK